MRVIRSPWRAVTAMFMLNGALFGIWASRIPAFVERHGLSHSQIGLLLLCLALGAIMAFPLAGRAADRSGAAPVTRKIAVAYTVALILLPLMPTPLSLAVCLFFFGATHGAMDVTMNAWAAEVERRSGRAMMSSFHAMFSLGAGSGAALGYFAIKLGMPVFMHFGLAASLLAIVTLWVAAIPWAADPPSKGHASPLLALPKAHLVLVGFVAFCSSMGEGAMADWSAVFLVTVTQASEAAAALGYAAFSCAMVATRLAGDRLVQMAGPVMTARAGGIVAATGAAIAVLSGSYGATLVGFALMGIGYAVIVPLAFSRAANDKTVSPGAGIASVATLGYGGLLLGPPIIGFVAEATSIRVSFAILSLMACVMVFLADVSGRSRAKFNRTQRTAKDPQQAPLQVAISRHLSLAV